MQIQILGSGCPTCKKLFETTSQAAKELNLPDKVEYITDIQKIVEMGVMQTPILAINGKPVLVGKIFDKEKVKEIIRKQQGVF